jgi:hypothetical protein
MPAKVPRAANSSSSNMNSIKADIKDICKKTAHISDLQASA